MENKFEMVFNEREDAAELKNLPIDDNMNGIIEEEEMASDVMAGVGVGLQVQTKITRLLREKRRKSLEGLLWEFEKKKAKKKKERKTKHTI